MPPRPKTKDPRANEFHIHEEHKALRATDAGESAWEIGVTFAGKIAVFVAIVLLVSGIPPWSLNGIAAILGVGLVAGVGMWWLVARARRKPPVYQWVVTYSAARWDSPLDSQSTLTRDRSGQYFLDNEAVARQTLRMVGPRLLSQAVLSPMCEPML